MQSEPRVVLLASACESTNIVFHALCEEFTVAAVVLEPAVSRAELLRRRVRRLGVSTVFGQLLFQTVGVPLLRRRGRERIDAIKTDFGLDCRPVDGNRTVHVPSVNSDECIEALQRLAPAVVVVNGTRIISTRVLASVDAVFLNTHTGITPLYRGVHGAYWAYAQGDGKHAGVTVHLVDSGIDTGGIVEQAVIEATDRDSFVTYPLLQLAAGIPMLKRAVAAAASGELRLQAAPEGASRLWSHPTIWQYIRTAWRRGVR